MPHFGEIEEDGSAAATATAAEDASLVLAGQAFARRAVPAAAVPDQDASKVLSQQAFTRMPAASAAAAIGNDFFYQSSAPAGVIGRIWIDSTTAIRYQWVNDGTSTQWVEF